MKRFLATSFALLILAACGVDTTGISKDSSRKPTGNPGAAVTVTEYGDLQCPACKAAYDTLDKPLLQKYGQQIAFEFKHFPLVTIHEHAMEAAEASECAADQGKFWEFLDTDYTKQADLSADALTQWGKDLGLNMDLFTRCRDSHIKRAEILADYKEGEKLGVQGTPTFFVNGTQVESTMDALSAAIDKAQAGGGQRL